MEGLPQHPGPVGLLILAIGLLVGVLYAWRVRRPLLSAVGEASAVSWILLVLLVSTVGVAPFLVWRIVEDIRYTSQIDPWLAPRYGVSVFQVHPEIFDNAALHIPPGDIYYMAAAPNIDRVARGAFRSWAMGYLLPRRVVADPKDAQWILTLGVDPASVAPVSRTWTLKESVNGLPPAYLGKVERP